MADLKSFLIDLAVNPALLERYTASPEQTVAAAGLSADDRAAILSGDARRLRVALGKPDNDCMSQVGIAVRDAKTGKRLRMTDIMPAEQKVTLDRDVEMTLLNRRQQRTTKVFKAGDTVVRHRRSSKTGRKTGKRGTKR